MKKTAKVQTIYNIIGRVLFVIAGGAVGFVLGGPVSLITGAALGYLVGLVVDKGTVQLLKRT